MLADVSRAEDIEAMVARAVEEFGRLDILVNNAVSSDLWGGDSPIADISEAISTREWAYWSRRTSWRRSRRFRI